MTKSQTTESSYDLQVLYTNGSQNLIVVPTASGWTQNNCTRFDSANEYSPAVLTSSWVYQISKNAKKGLLPILAFKCGTGSQVSQIQAQTS